MGSRRFAKATLGHFGLMSAICVLLAGTSLAAPVTYTMFAISDGKVGSWEFHHARVYLTFRGNTNNVQSLQAAGCDGLIVQAVYNPTGDASVTIISGSKVVSANFAPNQVFVSLDLGYTFQAPFQGGHGVGFSSYTATGAIEASYPLGIQDGTIDWGDIVNDGFGGVTNAVASPALQQLSTDLMHSTRFSGRAWPCVGFPGACQPPPALHTDHGDFYLYPTYAPATGAQYGSHDTLGGGFFVADVSESDESETSRGILPANLVTSHQTGSEHPVSYYGYAISDVTLGSKQYPGAQVYLSFDSDASSVVPFSSGNGFSNSTGNAHVTIVSGSKMVSADFEPRQIYVYYDIEHASIGFGSVAGNGARESGYPLSITANKDANGLVDNSLVGAVSDLTLVPAHAANYLPAVAALKTDLRNGTALSGGASSCHGFDPTTSTCSSLTPVPLRTSRGDFTISEPYRQDATGSGAVTYSVNWGVFWSETRSGSDE